MYIHLNGRIGEGVCIEDWKAHLNGTKAKVTFIFHRLITAMVIYGLMEMAFFIVPVKCI
jgi:hypothetical protein